jgi:hypothetical protein
LKICLQNTRLLKWDFSENFSSVSQEEVQSLHWAKTQTTIHLMVVTRPAAAVDEVEASHVQEHWLVISDEVSHDFNFVNHCIQHILLPQPG